VSGKNANLSLGMLCPSYVSSQRSSTLLRVVSTVSCTLLLAKYSLSQDSDKGQLGLRNTGA
jgi:hypothetical protein